MTGLKRIAGVVLGFGLIFGLALPGYAREELGEMTRVWMAIGEEAGRKAGAALDRDEERGEAIGAFFGTIFGGLIGYAWDRYDERNLDEVLETFPSGRSGRWVNPDTEMEWSATPRPAFQNHRYGLMREVTVVGKDRQGNRKDQTLRAYRRGDGRWLTVKSR